NTTVANAWGVLAMEKFSAAFESTPVAGTTEARYGARTQSVEWPRPSGDGELQWSWQEGAQSLEVSHSGSGAPWVTVQASAAVPLKQALSSGFKIKRTVTPVEQRRPGGWSRGDVM